MRPLSPFFQFQTKIKTSAVALSTLGQHYVGPCLYVCMTPLHKSTGCSVPAIHLSTHLLTWSSFTAWLLLEAFADTARIGETFSSRQGCQSLDRDRDLNSLRQRQRTLFKGHQINHGVFGRPVGWPKIRKPGLRPLYAAIKYTAHLPYQANICQVSMIR